MDLAGPSCKQIWPAKYLHGITNRVQCTIERLIVNDASFELHFHTMKACFFTFLSPHLISQIYFTSGVCLKWNKLRNLIDITSTATSSKNALPLVKI